MLSTPWFKILRILCGTTLLIDWVATSKFAFGENTISFYDLKLESLTHFSNFRTDDFKGHFSLWVLFQPSCASCKSQLSQLACLPANIETIALGTLGNRDQLSKALQFSSFRGKRLRASPELEKNLHAQATPTLYLVDRNGRSRKTFVGLISCDIIKTEFEKIDPL
jgi:hypothetical protein